MILLLPPAPQGGLNQYFTRLGQALAKALSPVVSQNEAAARVILQSPNGTNYNVTVDDAGTLVVAVNDGKTRP